MSITRKEVVDEALLKAIEIVTHHVGLRIEKHGRGAFASNHEGLGVVTEEYFELVEAVKQNDDQNYAEEMIDLAVSGIFGLASKIDMRTVSAPTDAPSEEEAAPQFTEVETAAEKARQMMIERAGKAGLIISSTI